MRISDWSSDVCSSDLRVVVVNGERQKVGCDSRLREGQHVGCDKGFLPRCRLQLDDVVEIGDDHLAKRNGHRFMDGVVPFRQFHFPYSPPTLKRSYARRVGTVGVSTFTSRWTPN